MTQPTDFNGFPKECLGFYADLTKNNNKAWFDAHRNVFDEKVMGPARAFVVQMGRRLRTIAPDVIADPRVNKSLFRINRDTRFSKDKRPYKTHLAIWFWEGARPRMECSGFYFHLEPTHLMLGVGIYMFPKPLLEAYRLSVVDPKHGPALAKAIGKLTQKGSYTLGEEHYKRVPAGYDPDHAQAALLRHNGLHLGLQTPAPKEVHSAALVDYCFARFQEMAPVHQWLKEMTDRAA